MTASILGQKAYNAREGIETHSVFFSNAFLLSGQKAYNAREGIETNVCPYISKPLSMIMVRKHTMLERALRRKDLLHCPPKSLHVRQKAYNAREGIETSPFISVTFTMSVRKHTIWRFP